MAITSTESAILSFVTREVEGDIETEVSKFDQKLGEVKKTKVKVKEPVVVFFPSGSTQIFSRAAAERKGFLTRPDILNFESVQNSDTNAGKFKFAMMPAERIEYWEAMEQDVINRCCQRGLPVPHETTFSKTSLFTEQYKQAEVA